MCPACSANPRYCSATGCNDPEDAIAYCKSQCGAGCTGFFFQTHTNGHEICGFFSEDPASFNSVWHSHRYGAVCVPSLSDGVISEEQEATLAVESSFVMTEGSVDALKSD